MLLTLLLGTNLQIACSLPPLKNRNDTGVSNDTSDNSNDTSSNDTDTSDTDTSDTDTSDTDTSDTDTNDTDTSDTDTSDTDSGNSDPGQQWSCYLANDQCIEFNENSGWSQGFANQLCSEPVFSGQMGDGPCGGSFTGQCSIDEITNLVANPIVIYFGESYSLPNQAAPYCTLLGGSYSNMN